MKYAFFVVGSFILLQMAGCSLFFPHNYRAYDKEWLFSNDYDSNYYGKFKIDGYYYLEGRYTIPYFMVFYPDGTLTENKVMGASYFGDVDGGDSIGLPIFDLTKLTTISNRRIGIYKVDGDSLRVDIYADLVSKWALQKYIYSIEDSTTLKLCRYETYSRKGVKSIENRDMTYKFAPAKIMFSIYDIELKKHRFLWSNDSDYTEYMDNLQRYKSNLINPFLLNDNHE